MTVTVLCTGESRSQSSAQKVAFAVGYVQLPHRYMKKHRTQSDIHCNQGTNSRTTLLSIPRELRDEIITLILTSRRPSLQTAAEFETQNRMPLGSDTSGFSDDSGLYLEERSAYTSNAGGLLLASKQLRSETQDALERLDLAHELEVKLVNERFLAPTWSLIPTQTRHFKRVRAVVQSIGAWQKPASPSKFKMRDPWASGCGGPLAYVWQFYSTLRHFLTYGVDVPRPTAIPDLISVDNLELDFIDPEDTDLLPPEGNQNIRLARCRPSGPGFPREPQLLRPEWLAWDLAGEMGTMFRMSSGRAPYAHMLHGRIGHMVFKVNGTIIAEIDVGQVLADVKFSGSFGSGSSDDLAEKWTNWKEEAQELRKKRGLKTVEFGDGWQAEARKWAAQHYARYPYS
ncbi:uncharacterized protein N0V89_006382 [Didymosphaeria variabile]|uniref:Uncharacterized protein n=1 Tax=Didymosphaeria variabile TaxID=1932322 RepID=A0A9W8XQ03_9PLEO|nr:uncharacterized protein N0V89_006382 [Didymosphaeria variabile]KAJ4354645.1 hypothetical protein N0V89_006382 [Didymosphaeria variabile]